MEKLPITVSECISLVNQTMEYAYPSLCVEGEVASFKVNQNKWVFFDLKDDEGTLGCFMSVFQMRTPLEDGMRVRVVASPKLTQWGKFSLTVREVQPVGEGTLKRAFEMLRTKLEKEGLFAPERKRSLPPMPSRVGVVSSTGAAGYKDFVTLLAKRWGNIEIVVANVQVQGADAPDQMIRAINFFNQQPEPVDVLVVVRGGGSADDLSAFNDEPLVRTIALSRIPTLVGVGHEVDTTLADLAADVRAATPSNAAEILVPDRREIVQLVSSLERDLARIVIRRCEAMRESLVSAQAKILTHIDTALDAQKQRLSLLQATLRQVDPHVVLKRGYALVRREDSTYLGRTQPQLHEKLHVETEKFTIETEVLHVTENN